MLGQEEAGEQHKFDKLELRNRTVTETLSLVENFGQDKAKPADSTAAENGNGVADEEAENGGEEKFDKESDSNIAARLDFALFANNDK